MGCMDDNTWVKDALNTLEKEKDINLETAPLVKVSSDNELKI
jgi:hypothetical protein